MSATRNPDQSRASSGALQCGCDILLPTANGPAMSMTNQQRVSPHTHIAAEERGALSRTDSAKCGRSALVDGNDRPAAARVPGPTCDTDASPASGSDRPAAARVPGPTCDTDASPASGSDRPAAARVPGPTCDTDASPVSGSDRPAAPRVPGPPCGTDASPASGSDRPAAARVPGPPCGTDASPANGSDRESASQSNPGPASCPFRSLGCPGAVGQTESVSGHLLAEMHSHSSLLVERVAGMERELRRVFSSELRPDCQWCGGCAQRAATEGALPSAAAEKNPDRPATELARLWKQVGSLQRQTSELAELVRETCAVSDRQLVRLAEADWQRETELRQLRLLVQTRLDAMQQQLGQPRAPHRPPESKQPGLRWWRRRKPEPGSKTSVDGLSPTNTVSTVNSELLDSLREERPAALVWEVGAVASKIGGRQELWSPYFRPAVASGGGGGGGGGGHTMRLWLRLNEALSHDRVPVELLVWSRNRARSQLLFEGEVTVTIRDKLEPFSFRSISSHCCVRHPDYSTVFDFRLADLEAAGVLRHDVISVECVVLCD